MPTVRDGLGRSVNLPTPATRIVSLAPSTTAAVAALGKPSSLIAVTKRCLEPSSLVVGLRKIGGPKSPDLETIIGLRPDLVLAEQEENLREDAEAVAAAGIPIYIFSPHSLSSGTDELENLARLLGVAAKRIVQPLREIIQRHQEIHQNRIPVRVFCPVSRNPYLAVGNGSYITDLLRLAGGRSVFERNRSGGRYPRVTLKEIMGADPDLILLPNDPFPFRQRHHTEFMALRGLRAVTSGHVYLIDGHWLTWNGPEVPIGLAAVEELLKRVQVPQRTALPPGLRFSVQDYEVVQDEDKRD